jgi:hypothetical protein
MHHFDAHVGVIPISKKKDKKQVNGIKSMQNERKSKDPPTNLRSFGFHAYIYTVSSSSR